MPRASLKPRQGLPRPQRDLANRIREALLALNLTQIEAAKLAGVSRDLIHKAVVRGSMPREARDREAIAKTLQVDAAYLWFGIGDKPTGENAPPGPEKLTIFNFRPDPKGYTLLIEHDGFSPMASRGDVLYVTPSYPARPGDRIFVRWDSSEGIFKLVEDGDNLTVLAPNGSRMTIEARKISEKARIAGVIFS